MATRRYKVSPGKKLEDVVEEAGAATNSDTVELTIDCAALIYHNGVAHQITREEVLQAIEKLEEYIIAHQWPPV